MNNNNNSNSNNNKFILLISFFIAITASVTTTRIIKYMNEKETFDNINENYKNLNNADKKIMEELQIYPDNFSRSYSNNKKEKLLFIISGFRDTPKMWGNLEVILKKNKIDYVIPRVTGFGRTYFQYDIKWNDWVISIMKHLYILQNLYQEINILGFSTGCNIPLGFLYHYNGIGIKASPRKQ